MDRPETEGAIVGLALATLPDRVLDLGAVDVRALTSRVAEIGEDTWASEDDRKENRFRVFHSTQHIVFRFIPRNRDHREFYSNPSWSSWSPLLMPIIEQAIGRYGFRHPRIPKAMLARLKAHGHIDRHVDGAESNLYTHKIHVPLITDPGVIMEVDDEPFHLEAGRAYEINNVVRHAVRNDSDIDRVHFIFEVFDAAEHSSGDAGRP